MFNSALAGSPLNLNFGVLCIQAPPKRAVSTFTLPGGTYPNCDGQYSWDVQALVNNALPGQADAGVDLLQAFLSVNWARKFNDKFAIGIGPVFAAQVFEARGLSAFASYTEAFAQYALNPENPPNFPWNVATSLTNNGKLGG